MSLLVDLCAEGHTILMVTHDAKVAAHAGRILHMQDGEIVNGDQIHVDA
jgi:macrolide transport system ATP-binding/permease protein